MQSQVKLYIDANLSPAARSAELAAGARKGVAELITTGRAAPTYRRFTDGVEGAREETVKAGGTIVYEFSAIGEAAEFALAFLQARSPARAGNYRKSFYLGVNGKFIKAASFAPKSVPLDAEIVIGNTQPYSRKVDVQLVGRRPLQFSVPAHLFDDAARAVKRQFGNTVTAKRVYTMSFPGQYLLRREQHYSSGANAGKILGFSGRRGATGRKGKPVESPALILQAIR